MLLFHLRTAPGTKGLACARFFGLFSRSEARVQWIGLLRLIHDIKGGISVFGGSIFKVPIGLHAGNGDKDQTEREKSPAPMDAVIMIQSTPNSATSRLTIPEKKEGPRPGLMLFTRFAPPFLLRYIFNTFTTLCKATPSRRSGGRCSHFICYLSHAF